jgi:hypothetical protein
MMPPPSSCHLPGRALTQRSLPLSPWGLDQRMRVVPQALFDVPLGETPLRQVRPARPLGEALPDTRRQSQGVVVSHRRCTMS